MTDSYEPQVQPSAPLPKGYQYVRKGNVYITKHCRQKTHEAGKTLYVVVNQRNKVLGLRCPQYIYQAVLADHNATASKRASAVQKKDDATSAQFEQTLLNLFPKTPKQLIPQIVKHATQKRSGRVGRTGKVGLEEKVKLAVRAHIRHCHTDYDKLLKEGTNRETARNMVWKRVSEVATGWGAKVGKQAGPHKKAAKKVAAKPVGTQVKGPQMVLPVRGKVAGIATAAPGPGLRVQTRQMTRQATNGVGTVEEPFEIIDDSDVDVFSMSEDDISDWGDWSSSDGDSE